jgi:S-methylmethionine-dependent homocysteine/selenocysteine methylase
MTAAEAEAYHATQIQVLAEAGAEMIGAMTLTNTAEAIGIARAAGRVGLPAAISFTLETDGALPTGMSLRDAISIVDEATSERPAYYMINCAHPSHFEHVLAEAGPWVRRLRGIRANASKRSHAELNESPTLDAGDPDEFGRDYRRLLARHPHLNVLGGCCGTNHRHVSAIGLTCLELA